MRALLTLAVIAALEGVAVARGYQDLGTLERQAVDDALALRGLTLDPQPDGKVIGRVLVVNLDVFSGRDLFFQFFNRFHWTTQEEMIRREALFRAGQPYDQKVIDETARNLESPVYTSALGIVAVMSPNAGQVDVLIVTRDLWSLRFNTNFEFQERKLISLSASLAENNLFGWRKSGALVLTMDQGKVAIGPTYVDPNIAGTRLTASGYARLNIGRESGQAEGYAAGGQVAYPLFSLASKWGGAVTYDFGRGIARSFVGTQLRQAGFDCDPDTKVCAVARDWVYRTRSAVGTAQATRRFMQGSVVNEFTIGHRLASSRNALPTDFPADPPDHPTVTQQFIQQVLPPSQFSSSIYASMTAYTPRYRIYRDLNTFDLRETVTLGPSLSLSLRQAARVIGSERDFLVLGAGAGWTGDLLDGLQAVSAGWSARHFTDGQGWTDQNLTAGFLLATPVLHRAWRVVAAGGTSILLDDRQGLFSALGGDSGLRGYTIGDFLGKSSVVGHLEVRSMALSTLSLRSGALIFYDVGDATTPDVTPGSLLSRAWNTFRGFSPHQDVGFGLRILIPQFNTYVLRLDWAIALQNSQHTHAGWPGRFSAGFSQAF